MVPDAGERRIGSLAGTVGVLMQLGPAVPGQRMLIIHSGGDARRLLPYAALGKAFTPLGLADGGHTALFDLLLATLWELGRPAGGEVLVASGDVLLTFDACGREVHRPGGVCGLAFPAEARQASKHGVYGLGAGEGSAGQRGDRRAVKQYVQKPGVPEQAALGLLDGGGRSWIDTGLVSLSWEACSVLLEAVGVDQATAAGDWACRPGGLMDLCLAGEVGALDLYREFLPALVAGAGAEGLMDQAERAGWLSASAAGREALAGFFARVQHAVGAGLGFDVVTDEQGEFFTVGMCSDLLSRVGRTSRTAQRFGLRVWDDGPQTLLRGHLADGVDEAVEVAGAGDGPGGVGPEGVVYAEACCLTPRADGRRARLGGRNVVVDWQGGVPDLPAGVGLTQIRLEQPRGGSLAVLFDLDDDHKSEVGLGAFGRLGLPGWWWAGQGLGLADLWAEGQRQDLWHARVWPVWPGDAADERLAFLDRFCGVLRAFREGGAGGRAEWAGAWDLPSLRAGPGVAGGVGRMSIAEALLVMDVDACVGWREHLRQSVGRARGGLGDGA